MAGKNELHRRLQVDEFTDAPRLVFMSTCTNTISQIPALPLDKNNSEDVDTKSEDHLYDALRYGIMTRLVVLFGTLTQQHNDQAFKRLILHLDINTYD